MAKNSAQWHDDLVDTSSRTMKMLVKMAAGGHIIMLLMPALNVERWPIIAKWSGGHNGYSENKVNPYWQKWPYVLPISTNGG